jgi:hypothetical protein
MRISAAWMALVLAPAVTGQTESSALDWAVALRGRYDQFKEPVASVYGTASLAKLVCAVDHAAGLGLYQEALRGLSMLTPQRFVEARHLLPSPSFTALWKSVTGNARKCDASLEQYFDNEHARAKIQSERQSANDTLRRANARIDSDPDRAGQLAEAAIGVTDADHLDIPLLTLFLSQLRDRAPEVSDDVFPVALDLIASAQAPSPGLLMELGKYLFVSHRYLSYPDKDENNDVFTVNGSSIANFQEIRQSTIPDEVRDYIEAAFKVLGTDNQAEYDPLAAYAIAYQLIPRVSDLAPDEADRLRELLAQLQVLAGTGASQVQSQLALSTLDPNSEDEAGKRAHVIRAVFSAVAAGKFAEARELGKGNSDLVSRNQIASLIDFGEAAAAASHKEIAWASTLANSLVPGVKRSMLYAGIAAVSSGREAAIGPLQLALRDIQALPAEQRTFTLAANAGAIFNIASDNGLTTLGLLIEAANDAYMRPRKGFFDPKILRRFDRKADLGTDSPLILFNRRGLCEVVDTGQHRYTFGLKIPGVSALTLPAVLPLVREADPARLEALILGLQDEMQLAYAMNALAAIRLNAQH